MSAVLLLTVVAVAQQMLVAVMWAGAARVGLSRPAVLHWALAALANGSALVLVALRQELPPLLAFTVPNALGLLGIALLRRGVHRFCDVAHPDRGAAGLLLGVVAFNATVVLAGLSLAWVVFATALALAWLLLGTAAVLMRRLPFEFGRHIGLALSLPVGLMGLAFLVRGALAPVMAGSLGQTLLVQHPAVLVFAAFLVVAMLLVQFSLGAMVVLRLVRQLRHLSTHDALTGVLNRRGLDDRLDRELDRLHRYGQPFALVSLDIDHFKAINDRHGHAAGDEVLVRVADVLAGGLREVDVLGRTGGEEFCVLMPHTDLDAAVAAATRLQQRLRVQPVGPDGLVVTVSAGVACAGDRRERRDQLLRRLDAALYAAKSGGRDRLVPAAEPDSALRLAAD